MAAPPPRFSTYADLLALRPDARAEILGGEIVAMSPSLPRHANARGALSHFIGGPFHDDDGRGGPGGWWIFIGVDIELSPHDIVRPDLSGWRRERLATPGPQRPIEIVPDWICEIVSPATAARDRVLKRDLYRRASVASYWMIDPQARTLEALTLRDGSWVDAGAFDATSTARIPPFEAVELEIDRLFLPRDADDPPPEP